MRTLLQTSIRRLTDVYGARRRERDITAELQSHLDMHIAENLRSGMTPDEARRRALVALGGVAQTRERYRDAFRLTWLDALRLHAGLDVLQEKRKRKTEEERKNRE